VHTGPGKPPAYLERTGYLLSLGTVPPCSGECYGCGRLTVPTHRRAQCQGPAIPTKESTFRSLCAKHLREDIPQAAVNAVLEEEEEEEEDPLGWMDFAVAPEEDFPQGPSV
jgi:hypothetical protein